MKHRLPSWAVERRVFPLDEEERLIHALTARQIGFREFVGHEFRVVPELAEAAVPRGSCYFVREMSRLTDWPGELWGEPRQFDCASCLASFGPRLLNAEGRFLSLGELLWRFPEILAELGDAAGRLFVRPDDGFKTFEGSLVSSDGFEAWARQLQVLQVPAHCRVVAARPAHVLAEWRVAVVAGRAVAASQYKPMRQTGAPGEVMAFAEDRHRDARLPAVYAMDIAQTDVGLKIIEIGSLLCVAFYESDAGAIVDAIQPLVEAIAC